MHERLRPVREFLLIDRPVRPLEPPWRRRHDRVLHDRLVHPVDLLLRRLADVDIPIPGNAALHREQRVDHERVFPVVIQARLRHGLSDRLLHDAAVRHGHRVIPLLCVVLRRLQDGVAHQLREVQHLPAVLIFLVIPVHHHRLVVKIDDVVRVVLLLDLRIGVELSPQLRVLLDQQIVVHHLRQEDVLRLLQIPHARLPEERQNIHRLHRDIPEAVQLRRIPLHVPDERALLELRPLAVRIDLFEVVLFQNDRQHRGKLRRLLPVVRFPRADGRGRIGRDRVRMLAHDDVEKPRRRPLVILRVSLLDPLPAAHAPPVLRRNDPRLQRTLALPVFLQRVHGLSGLLFADGLSRRQPARRVILHGRLHLLCLHCPLPPSAGLPP